MHTGEAVGIIYIYIHMYMWWPLGSQYFIFPTCLEGSSSARGAGCLTMFDITQDIYQHLIYIKKTCIYIYVMYIYIYPFRTSKAHNFSCSLKFDEICTFARFGALAKFMRPSRKKTRVWTLLSPSLTLMLCKLRWVAENHALVALFCARGCTPNDHAIYRCEASKSGFRRFWLNCAPSGKLRAFCQYSQCTVDWLLRAIFGDSTLFVRHVLCSRMIYITGFHHGNRFGVVLRVQPSQQPKPPEFKSYQPTWWTEPSRREVLQCLLLDWPGLGTRWDEPHAHQGREVRDSAGFSEDLPYQPSKWMRFRTTMTRIWCLRCSWTHLKHLRPKTRPTFGSSRLMVMYHHGSNGSPGTMLRSCCHGAGSQNLCGLNFS